MINGWNDGWNAEDAGRGEDPGRPGDSDRERSPGAFDVDPPEDDDDDPVFLTGELTGLKVLLVEDAPDNRFLLSRFLVIAGAEVDTAEHGGEAIEKADAAVHDVVLMDIQMPVLDGFEATARLRAAGFDKPIIALTAHALRSERERSRNAGFDDYLTKPIGQAALVRTLKKLHLDRNAQA